MFIHISSPTMLSLLVTAGPSKEELEGISSKYKRSTWEHYVEVVRRGLLGLEIHIVGIGILGFPILNGIFTLAAGADPH